MQTPCLLSHIPPSMHAHYSAESEAHDSLMVVQEEKHPSKQACDWASSRSEDKSGCYQLFANEGQEISAFSGINESS